LKNKKHLDGNLNRKINGSMMCAPAFKDKNKNVFLPQRDRCTLAPLKKIVPL
jgi:hypothetical protein